MSAYKEGIVYDYVIVFFATLLNINKYVVFL